MARQNVTWKVLTLLQRHQVGTCCWWILKLPDGEKRKLLTPSLLLRPKSNSVQTRGRWSWEQSSLLQCTSTRTLAANDPLESPIPKNFLHLILRRITHYHTLVSFASTFTIFLSSGTTWDSFCQVSGVGFTFDATKTPLERIDETTIRQGPPSISRCRDGDAVLKLGQNWGLKTNVPVWVDGFGDVEYWNHPV